jgi:hypothetical protein
LIASTITVFPYDLDGNAKIAVCPKEQSMRPYWNTRFSPAIFGAMMAASLLLLMSGCPDTPSGEASGPATCKVACEVCGASNVELKTRFGKTEIPKEFSWAMPYVDGPGYAAFEACTKMAVKQRTTTDALGCNDKALGACIEACETKTQRK